MDADDGRPVSFLAHEAGHAGGAEPAAGLLMRLEYLGAAGRPPGDRRAVAAPGGLVEIVVDVAFSTSLVEPAERLPAWRELAAACSSR